MKEMNYWNPNDQTFWASRGKSVANQNLWISIPNLLIAFSVWQIWSILSLQLTDAGFPYTTEQVYSLTAIPALTGALVRVFYSIGVTYTGGKTWTVLSTLILLVPVVGISLALQNPETPYSIMALLAALCGFGGGNFASSMAAIGPFFPKSKQGSALGINGGLGNLGVSLAQFLIPLVITIPLFGQLGGPPQTIQTGNDTTELWLQNGALVWIIPIVLFALMAWFGMTNLPLEKPKLSEQLRVFRRKHMYLITILYIMSFGSFIGYSAAFPLLLRGEFPEINGIQLVFIGPLLGALGRPVGGYLADKIGGAKVSIIDIGFMIIGVIGVLIFISENFRSFLGFFLSFLLLFAAGGIANGSIFTMFPIIFGPSESPAAIGLASAIGAFGGFFIPQLFGWSIKNTGDVSSAFYVFVLYYLFCAAIIWIYYARDNAEVPIDSLRTSKPCD
ncbi:MFS transporter, NNP family, nitrate/nitrite transporter [Mesobacillus persicus]|uniref:MFS transporter, NNP family, nitrate/nitrite transporter n=1 Tax=Mesobacillus persicus TaxID=930146 RepID=A0A1H8GI12_9BACI|nr:MFS transporter [Mesobacillus persicus]SEN43656.1 MFS transporter, NNP family, nitrate/nitrite transporter [Mesobacillus persicus]